MKEKRQFARFGFDSQATLESNHTSWDTQVIDISLRGALLARPPGWSGDVGDSQQIDVELSNGESIAMDVTIAHVDQNRVGCRCDRIDMQSFAHLRQLVLANLGSEDALNRELAALA